MNKLQANVCLLCVTFCWSTEVIIFASIPGDVHPFATTCITSAIAAVILAFFFRKRIADGVRSSGNRVFRDSILLGVINCLYNALYIYGLKYFDVSSGAFTLCMTAVVLPVVLLIIREKVSKKTWLSAMLITAGMFFALAGTVRGEQLIGLLIIGAGSVLRAVYIVLLNKKASEHDPVTLSTLVTSAICLAGLVIWFIGDHRLFMGIEWTGSMVASFFIYGYFVAGFAMTLNIFAQRGTTAATATIIYSLEIVFSVIWGAILPPNLITPVAITPRVAVGVMFVVAGGIVEVIDFRNMRGKGAARLEK